jgi:hypothetical protein
MLTAFPDGCTSRNLRDTLGMSGDRINRVLDGLIERGVVVKTVDTIIDRRRPKITYSRVQAFDLSAEAIRSRPEKSTTWRLGSSSSARPRRRARTLPKSAVRSPLARQAQLSNPFLPTNRNRSPSRQAGRDKPADGVRRARVSVTHASRHPREGSQSSETS